MTICPNCGKELMDGEVCTCATPVPDTTPAPEPIAVDDAGETLSGVDSAPVTEKTEPVYDYPVDNGPAMPYQDPQMNYNPNMQYAQNPDYNQNYNPNGGYMPNPYYVPPQPYPPVPPQPVVQKVPASTDYPEGYKIKKKYVAVLLAYTLGVFGIHNFYLGNKSKALAQVLVSTIAGMFTFGLATCAVLVWSLVECVLLLTENIDADANGYKIQTLDEAINKKEQTKETDNG